MSWHKECILNSKKINNCIGGLFMKALLLSVLVLSSLNAFASDLGEKKSVDCEFANQSQRAEKEQQVQSSKKEDKKKENTVGQ